MHVTVRIPSPLRKLTGGESKIKAEAGPISAILGQLIAQHPDLQPRLFDEEALRPEVRVFVGETDIRNLQGLETEVADGQTVALLLPIAGA
ncbi:MAG: MoaD/ThiS family protein [Armatimonadota bacterium]